MNPSLVAKTGAIERPFVLVEKNDIKTALGQFKGYARALNTRAEDGDRCSIRHKWLKIMLPRESGWMTAWFRQSYVSISNLTGQYAYAQEAAAGTLARVEIEGKIVPRADNLPVFQISKGEVGPFMRAASIENANLAIPQFDQAEVF
jgi:hypothetical protein